MAVLFALPVLLLCCFASAKIDPIHAVNLGGHLVPEPFIAPDFWEQLNLHCPASKDIWNLCECTNQNPSASSQVKLLVAQHLKGFLDLGNLAAKINDTKINAFRYPISFTYFLDQKTDPGTYQKYQSCGLVQENLKHSSFEDILRLAKQSNVRVILDLHQVEGCQNGFDNGGHWNVKNFFNSQNVAKGINTWKRIIQYLQDNKLMDLIWGFELLNEPVAVLNNATETSLLKLFTETVVNQILSPVISSNQYIVLQPGPGDDQVAAYSSYNLAKSDRVILDFHQYIVFGSELFLKNIDGSFLDGIRKMAGVDYGNTKFPYIYGEWSLATTDCAQYLNGGFGGFDPDYYEKEHASRTTFFCNQVNQTRDNVNVGFQTCSVIARNKSPFYGMCVRNQENEPQFIQFRNSMCSLFKAYLDGFKTNPLNVGHSFWTFMTGTTPTERRITQWDFSWAVDNGIIDDLSNFQC